MLLLIDNYDSFTYNLYQYFSELGEEVQVFRNDMITLEEIETLKPERLAISPGPGTPENAGISLGLIKHFAGRIPILGVCLGHQCIGQAFGGVVSHAGEISHGKISLILHDSKGVFQGMEQPLPAIRYHSLAVEPCSIPDCLQVTAMTDKGIIMGLRHRKYTIEGVQFHPESILSRNGKSLLRNFLLMENKS